MRKTQHEIENIAISQGLYWDNPHIQGPPKSEGAWDGWLLFYQPVDGVSVDALGRLCVVRVGGELAVRVVARGYSPGRFNLKSWTGEFFEDVILESAAPVLWMRQ